MTVEKDRRLNPDKVADLGGHDSEILSVQRVALYFADASYRIDATSIAVASYKLVAMISPHLAVASALVVALALTIACNMKTENYILSALDAAFASLVEAVLSKMF